MNEILLSKIQKIKLVVSDVDGVLTDGSLYFSENGLELKKFNVKDGLGFVLLQNAGIKTGIITTDNSPIINARAKRFKPTFLVSGTWEKPEALHKQLVELNITIDETAYIGDDVNDSEILGEVGFSAAPSDAVEKIKNRVDYICKAKGGEGAFRELADLILAHSTNAIKNER